MRAESLITGDRMQHMGIQAWDEKRWDTGWTLQNSWLQATLQLSVKEKQTGARQNWFGFRRNKEHSDI